MTSRCQDIQPQLSDYLDRTLDPEARAVVAAHLSECAACRGVLRDLEHLQAAARSLGPITPPDHIGLEVAGQIRLAPRAAAPGASASPAGRQVIWQWVGIAAALVIVTLVAFFMTRTPPAPQTAQNTPPGNATGGASVELIEQELREAESHYDKAISQLETIVKSDDPNNPALTPAVAAVLQKNLPVMDQAISESRAALTGDPGNQAARDSLFDTLKRKVSVLQDTVALMNEMRKGDQAGAARVAAGIGKS